MYYQSYDDYMRDIFYYNNMGNSMNMGYYPNNYMLGANFRNGYIGMGGGYLPGMNNNINNYNNLYPSIYRIVYPVVQKVTSENRFNFINDETVTNATDTVYNIIEGDSSIKQINNSTQKNRRYSKFK